MDIEVILSSIFADDLNSQQSTSEDSVAHTDTNKMVSQGRSMDRETTVQNSNYRILKPFLV